VAAPVDRDASLNRPRRPPPARPATRRSSSVLRSALVCSSWCARAGAPGGRRQFGWRDLVEHLLRRRLRHARCRRRGRRATSRVEATGVGGLGLEEEADHIRAPARELDAQHEVEGRRSGSERRCWSSGRSLRPRGSSRLERNARRRREGPAVTIEPVAGTSAASSAPNVARWTNGKCAMSKKLSPGARRRSGRTAGTSPP